MTVLNLFAPSGVELRTQALKRAKARLTSLGFEVVMDPACVRATSASRATTRPGWRPLNAWPVPRPASPWPAVAVMG
jgi:hypothetical protein